MKFVRSIYGARLLGVILLGSRANGYSTPTSDVDIHVLVKDITPDDAVGLYKFKSESLEFHTIAVDATEFQIFAQDTRAQTMENVALTLFRYVVLEGHQAIAAAQSTAILSELATLRAWLAKEHQEFRRLDEFTERQIAELMIIRKLSHAPPLVERFQRKVRATDLSRTIDDVVDNLRSVSTRGAAVEAQISGALASGIRNLMALSGRHGKILRDKKAVRGGLIYGLPYLALVILEIAMDRRRVGLLVGNLLGGVGSVTDDDAVSSFLEGANPLVAFARSKRNRWKDMVV